MASSEGGINPTDNDLGVYVIFLKLLATLERSTKASKPDWLVIEEELWRHSLLHALLAVDGNKGNERGVYVREVCMSKAFWPQQTM